MKLLTLSDFKPIISNKSTSSLVSSHIQQQFRLLVKQMLMGLPVEPILDNYPQFQQWITSLKELVPSLFVPHKKLFVDLSITARLEWESENANNTSSSFPLIEVQTNVGIIKGRKRLFEWGIRQPSLSYSDRIKLWVATEHFQVNPEEMQLIVLALHPTKTAQKVLFNWDSKQHKLTHSWLVKRMNPSIATNTKNTDAALALAKSLDQIEEIPL
ncbi:hypothetical protein ACE1CI_12075 [Aerosakkonemataceae cyanobacterium BLCC-F50]|uniref:Uncharacterized protein n=1 Tax=Floridaenema flaviceps BLCC-F50 TaxID=3153642 RepID=A0ABV4XPL3_9CYAN